MIVQKISPCHFQLFPKAFSIQVDQRFDSILEKRCKCCVRWWPPHPRADLRGILGSLRGCTEAPSAGQQPPPQIGWTGHWSVHTLLFCYFFHLQILACTCMSDQNCIPLTFLVPRLDKSKLLLEARGRYCCCLTKGGQMVSTLINSLAKGTGARKRLSYRVYQKP